MPEDKSDVKQCAYLSGSSHVPPDQTLILIMRNRTNGDPNKYVEFVFDWQNASALTSWSGAQYFGSPGQNDGQRYTVDLAAVDLEAAKEANKTGNDAPVNALANVATVLDSIAVQRVAGTVSNNCVGP